MPLNIFSASGRKVLFFEDYIQSWLRGQPKEPICLEIHPSERCNHRCPNCQSKYSIGSTKAKQVARAGEFLDMRLLEGIWDRPPLGIVISGHTGEPLMHPEIGSLFELLLRKSIPGALVTNGTRLTPDIAQVAIQACRGIRISLDAYDAVSYKKIHGVNPDEWERAKASIVLLIEKRRQLGLSPKECLIGVGYLTNKKNKLNMEMATKIVSSLGADYIHFRPYHYSETSIADVITKKCKCYENENFSIWGSDQKYDIIGSSRNYHICHGAHMFNVIDARGDIYICCHHVLVPEAKFASLKNISWSDWVNSQERREKIKSFVIRPDNCIPLCRVNAINEVLEARRRGITLTLPEGFINRHHAVFL